MEKFKNLFKGKKKFITIPLFFGLLMTFLPIVIGLGLIWLIVKKIKNKKIKKILLIIISIFTLFFGSIWIYALSQPTSPKVEKTEIKPTPTQAQEVIQNNKSDKQEVKVIDVVDGDTIKVLIGETMEKVRFIGVNTPETVDPRTVVECFGEKSSEETKNKLTNQIVWLESDSTQGDRDKYGRLLRYVWIDEAKIDFGKTLISNGFAHEYTYNIPYKYQESYKLAQSEAEQNKKGLWSDNACPVTPTVTNSPTLIPTKKITIVPTKKPTVQPTIKPTNISITTNTTGGCGNSCSGPDLDCSDFSTHAKAQAFFNCCGFTAEHDPMKLDSTGIGDGVACESLP